MLRFNLLKACKEKSNFRQLLRYDANIATPVSRKSRAAAHDSHKKSDFSIISKNLLLSISNAVSHMKEVNKVFNITVSDTDITIDIGDKGQFIIKADKKLERITVATPVSGFFTYKYNEENKTWLSVDDSHDLRGLITRDFVRICVGCPNF